MNTISKNDRPTPWDYFPITRDLTIIVDADKKRIFELQDEKLAKFIVESVNRRK